MMKRLRRIWGSTHARTSFTMACGITARMQRKMGLDPLLDSVIHQITEKHGSHPAFHLFTTFFNEGGSVEAKIKIGTPHFVDFGRNMRFSPDGKAYLVVHGATRPWIYENWITGDQIYLTRVLPCLTI